MERNENPIGPKYAIRLRDLRSWHRIVARCFRCQHEAVLGADFLAWERPGHSFLTELEPKLRCTHCGNRAENKLSVRALPRD